MTIYVKPLAKLLQLCRIDGTGNKSTIYVFTLLMLAVLSGCSSMQSTSGSMYSSGPVYSSETMHSSGPIHSSGSMHSSGRVHPAAHIYPSGNTQHSSPVDLFELSVDAQRAYRESRWTEAVALYQRIVEHVPADAAAWFHLANTYAQQGAFDRAIYAYEQSLKYDSEQPKAWFNLSTAYLMHAQSAMRQSYVLMRADNTSRSMVEQRMSALDVLVR